MQKVAHNHLVNRIQELRTKLEAARGDQIIENQAEIKEARRLLAVLHKHDSKELQEVYYG